METHILNIYPIFKIFCILLAIVGAYSTINNFMHLLARFGKDKLDNKKDIHAKDCDTDIVQDLIQRCPLVIENTQNLHEHDKKLEKIDRRLETIEHTIEEIRRTQRGGL